MVSGIGYVDGTLSADDIADVVANALSSLKPASARRVLFLAPRASDALLQHICDEITRGLEANGAQVTGSVPSSAMRELGAIDDEALPGGRLAVNVPMDLQSYDHVLCLAEVRPDPIYGFSGGNDVIVTTLAGADTASVIAKSALQTRNGAAGRRDVWARKVVDRAAALLPCERSCFALVRAENKVAGLFHGTPEEAWSSAAELSNRVHVRYEGRACHTVLAQIPVHLTNVLDAARCIPLVEGIIEDGGTLILYGPQVCTVDPGSDEECRLLWCGRERFDVVPALGMPARYFEGSGVHATDPSQLRLDAYRGRQMQGILFIDDASKYLYRLRGQA